MIRYDGEEFLDPFELHRLEKAKAIAAVHIEHASQVVALSTQAAMRISAIASAPMFPPTGGIVVKPSDMVSIDGAEPVVVRLPDGWEVS